MGDRRAGQPRGVRGEVARWKVCEGAVDEVGEDLLDDRVIAVLLFGLDQVERAVGEDGVVPVEVEQFVLAEAGLRVEPLDPAAAENFIRPFQAACWYS
jgi:hypothetical protein